MPLSITAAQSCEGLGCTYKAKGENSGFIGLGIFGFSVFFVCLSVCFFPQNVCAGTYFEGTQ